MTPDPSRAAACAQAYMVRLPLAWSARPGPPRAGSVASAGVASAGVARRPLAAVVRWAVGALTLVAPAARLASAGQRRPAAARRQRRAGRRGRRLAMIIGLVGFLLALTAGTASAHPLGSFTVNTASVLRVAPDRVRVDVVVDFAEIPAAQARPALDAAGPAAWRDRECARIAGDVRLSVAGRPARLGANGASLTLPPGQGGLATMRLVCRYATADAPGLLAAGGTDLTYELGAYTDRAGWRETVAVGDTATLVRSDVPDRSASALLTAYPTDPLAGRSDVTHASLRARPGGAAAVDPFPDVPDGAGAGASASAGAGPAGAGSAGAPARPGDGPAVSRPGNGGLTARFTGLVHPGTALTVGAAAIALVSALVLGAAHAFAPGHGKTLMAAMIVGRRATRRQLAGMAGAVTLTHTLGVFVLAVTLSASAGFAPERVYPWLGAASGLLMIGLGLGLLRSRLGRGPHRPALLLGLDAPAGGHSHDHAHGAGHADAHDHGHTHGVGHADGHDHGHAHGDGDGQCDADSHGDGHGHGDEPADFDHALIGAGVGVRHAPGHSHGGRTPAHGVGVSPTGRHPDGHSHAHDHCRGNVHGHAPRRVPDDGHTHTHTHNHGHGHGGQADRPDRAHAHRHGGRWHSHAPVAAADGTPVPVRSLLLTGLAGGLVPTPSAVVVLLGAISLGRASFGVLLVVAYGLGMAGTLVGVGYLLDRTLRPLLIRLQHRAPRLAATAFTVGPVVSALTVVGVGAFLLLRTGLAMPI